MGLLTLLAICAGPLMAAEPPLKADGHIVALPKELAWKPAPASLPPGAEVAVLEGDMTLGGYFAVRVKLPAGYRLPPHTHPAHERVTVIEGSYWLGHGEVFDPKGLKEIPTGAYSSMPPRMKHFAMTKDGAVLQIATVGPWGINYVNASDDPRKGQAQAAEAPSAPGLEVTVEGLRSIRGDVGVALYNAKTGYPTHLENAYETQWVPAEGKGSITVAFDAAPPGVYAVSVLHDANGNHLLDRSALGFPKEGVGFSNDCKVTLRAPRFDECRFTLEAGEAKKLAIKLDYRD